jgi:hypothetical protein
MTCEYMLDLGERIRQMCFCNKRTDHRGARYFRRVPSSFLELLGRVGLER